MKWLLFPQRSWSFGEEVEVIGKGFYFIMKES